jgi:phosphoribosylanthranilate isomerase
MLIQIAGIRNLLEAQMLMDAGVEYLGFPLRLDVHEPDLSEQEAKEVISKIKEPHKAVLITYLDKADEINEFANYLGVKYIQLHGPIELEVLKQLSQFTLFKSLVIRDEINWKTEIDHYQDHIDYFITDTYDPSTGASGATGKTHDWNISAEIVEYSKKPVILAGGLTVNNVAQAITKVKPAGVDCHTGVEDKYGNKEKSLIKQFVTIAKETK